jgi:predicted amidophosphoribosyltransferase
MQNENNLYCCKCGKPATWIRRTQFAGDHPFCTECAKKEKNFGDSDPSYFDWKEVPADQIAPKHKTSVSGYDGSLQSLVEKVHRMRYDVVAEFYMLVAQELRKQATSDCEKENIQLAVLLEEAVNTANRQQEQFARIWRICESHMKKQ